MKNFKFSIISIFLLALTQPAAAETITLACKVAFQSCKSGNCKKWNPVFTVNTSSNTVKSNNSVYDNEETTYTDVHINSNEIRFNNGAALHIINRITAEMVVDLSESQLAKAGNLYGKCEKGAAQF
ncbi:MAG TPA: hypothetical protein VJ654_18445 [Noviherbaspirillum sp.]|nr:hypothetical protein [Noviherbaspirillum sp.]